jgi:hypothetical protein
LPFLAFENLPVAPHPLESCTTSFCILEKKNYEMIGLGMVQDDQKDN